MCKKKVFHCQIIVLDSLSNLSLLHLFSPQLLPLRDSFNYLFFLRGKTHDLVPVEQVQNQAGFIIILYPVLSMGEGKKTSTCTWELYLSDSILFSHTLSQASLFYKNVSLVKINFLTSDVSVFLALR